MGTTDQGNRFLSVDFTRFEERLAASLLVEVKIQKLHPQAVLPQYEHGPIEDAGMDLRSVERATILPGQTVAVSTGLAIQLSMGLEAQIRSRSGLALLGITVANAPGTIDPGYRGEIKVLLHNAGPSAWCVLPGERVAQMVVARYEMVSWAETELEESSRGTKGLGSSGK